MFISLANLDNKCYSRIFTLPFISATFCLYVQLLALLSADIDNGVRTKKKKRERERERKENVYVNSFPSIKFVRVYVFSHIGDFILKLGIK